MMEKWNDPYNFPIFKFYSFSFIIIPLIQASTININFQLLKRNILIINLDTYL